MKTSIVCSTWLGTDDYYQKTIKFLDYYSNPEVYQALGLKSTKDIWLIDNASDKVDLANLVDEYNVSFHRYEKHLPRTAHLEYPYCWRQLYFGRELFQEHDYEKVIHLNNDVYILNKKTANKIRDLKSIWWSPYCPKHGFPECDLQVYTKDVPAYWEMTGRNYMDYNGEHMEKVISTFVDEEVVSDRHSEYGITEQQPEWDISCQVRLPMKMVYSEN